VRLQNKIALVSGSNKGIGLSIVKTLLVEDCIVYAGVRDKSKISEELFVLSRNYTNKLILIELDVTLADSCKSVFQRINQDFGKLDILVNNAGIVSYELVPFINFDFFEKMLTTNVIGLIRMCQLASRIMIRNKSGSIINISSVVSVKGAAGQAAYAASKGAVNSFTLSFAKEIIKSGVRVNALAPGMVATERFIENFQEKFKDKINQIGIGRLANPEEIAKVCLFLASDDSSYLTGQVICADGILNI
jgi:3-oxoacyl-[acyl-carrier protein] reductase